MKRIKLLTGTLLLLSALFVISSPTLFSWGYWAHREIHRHAIETLPEGPKSFFQHHADSIVSRSIEPDERRWVDSVEAYYHYIDIDRYGAYPFNELPRDYNEAVKKFGKAYVDTTGTAPWRIADFTARLSDAMRRNDAEEIQFYASNLGHYVADINVPLHTVVNYDGQLTGQKGIHSRWESHLPSRYGKTYTLATKNPEYIKNPLATAFDIILESYQSADKLLVFDREAQKEIPKEKLFTFIMRDSVQVRVFSDEYYERYHNKLGGMVEERMNRSIHWVASFWYTAWVDAGKPKLTMK